MTYTVTGGATPRSRKTTWTVRKDGRATAFGYFDKALALAKRDELEAADRVKSGLDKPEAAE